MVCIHSSTPPLFFAFHSTLFLSTFLHILSLLGHMASLHTRLLLLLLLLLSAALVLQGASGSRVQMGHHKYWKDYRPHREVKFKDNPTRLLIGSVAPTCTYNECRGCRYKCRAEQVPVEGNDPINSAYHYKCVCHR